MNKKAAVVGIISVFGVIAAFIVYFSLINQSAIGKEDYLGSLQLGILKAFGKAESKVNYIEKAVKLNSEQSIYELGLNGGYSKKKESKCGVIEKDNIKYYIWSDKFDKDCYPEVRDNILGPNYFIYFDENFDDMLENSLSGFDKGDFKCKLISEDGEFIPVVCNGLVDIEEPIVIKQKKESVSVPYYSEEAYFGIYGGDKEEIREQLVNVNFMGKDVQFHKKAAPALEAVVRDISKCEEGKNYDYYSVGTFNWRRNVNNPNRLSLHSFGIAIDINPDENPNCPDWPACGGRNICITDLPQCVVDAFKRNGFVWGCDFKSVKDAMHFEYMSSKGIDISNVEIGTYTTNLNFKINSKYNFKDYDLISEKVKECNQLKTGEDGTIISAPTVDEIEICVNSGSEFEWFVRQSGDYFLFDVVTDKKFLVFDGEKYDFKEVRIIFAIESKESLVPETTIPAPGISPLSVAQ